MDVRKPKDIKGFRDLVLSGPLTLVLVYADWCPHCVNFKKNVWTPVANSGRPRNINMAAVHYDMMENTPLSGAQITGYPSLMLVGTDEKPAKFTGAEEGAANAMPNQPGTPAELANMLATPLPGTVRNANAVATTVMQNANAGTEPVANAANAALETMGNTSGLQTVRANTSGLRTVRTKLGTETIGNTTGLRTVPVNNIVEEEDEIITNGLPATVATRANTYVPTNSNELPPDALTDMVEVASARTGEPPATMRGGSLLESLYAITKEGAHAGLLVASTAAFVRRARNGRRHGRPTRKGKAHKKSRTRRTR